MSHIRGHDVRQLVTLLTDAIYYRWDVKKRVTYMWPWHHDARQLVTLLTDTVAM